MFEQLVNEAASRLGLPASGLTALTRELLSMMTNERTGGPDGFVDLFRRAGIGDVITSWFGGKQGRTITPSHLDAALGTSTLDRLASASGLTRPAVMSALTFVLPKVIGRLTPTSVLPSSSALRSQLSRFMEPPSVTAAESRGMATDWGWLPWAAVALLAIVALLWLRGSSGTIDPQLTLSNRDGRVTYSGLVRDEATQTAIVEALRATFGAANVEGSLRIDRNVRRAAWLPRLDDLLATLKTPGVDFSLNGNAIGLGGWLSAADRQALGDKLRGIVGTQATIGSLADPAAEVVRAANDRALSALGAIGTSGVSADALVRAMNLAIINFPTASAEVPADALEIIRKSAEAIKRAPTGSTIEVGGHTDNTGDAARNLALSQARADAVKETLVRAGVPASMLTTRGYGDTRPRATNDTEYGRFQNRRIEYAVAGG